MRDGWRVIQVSPPLAPPPGSEHLNSTLPNEYVLERLVDVGAAAAAI